MRGVMPSTASSSRHRPEVEALAAVRAIVATPNADVNRRSSKGLTLLHAAAMHGHAAVITELLSSQHTVDLECRYEGWTALMLATRHHHCSCVQLLVAAGADVTLVFRPKRAKMPVIHCLPVDAAAKTAVISAARAGFAEYNRRLRSMMLDADAPLASLPSVLIDEIAHYVAAVPAT